MTAKQALREWVDGLTEEEARERLPLIADAGEPPALTGDQLVSIRRALSDIEAGRTVPHAEVKRRFGIR